MALEIPIEHSNDPVVQCRINTSAIRVAKVVAIVAAFLTLWSFTHHYGGLSGDGELYAIQALARLVPPLGKDIFLENTSQDRFTVFSPLYASVIGWVGIQTAAALLTILFKIVFFGAVWALARVFVNGDQALIVTALFIVIKGVYGSYSVFYYNEDFLTARLVAESLVLTSLALHYRGFSLSGLLIAIAALFIHVLMALPALLLLLCIRTPPKVSLMVAAGGCCLALAVACYGSTMAPSTGLFAIMDPLWLEIVRERSQFLFLQLWTPADWLHNGRPFISLLLTLLVTRSAPIKKLTLSSMVIGITGVAIGFIAGAIGPVAILLQGQAWRWLWVPACMAVMLVVPTVIDLWHQEKCGRLCAVLLLLGWTFSPINSLGCLLPALGLWLVRGSLRSEMTPYLRCAALVLAAIAILWSLKISWDAINLPATESGLEALVLTRTRGILGLPASALLVAWLIYRWISWNKSMAAVLLCCATFAATAAVSLPRAFYQPSRDGTASEIKRFEDWRAAIPPASNVFVVPAHTSAAFTWFTLQRPSYLTVDQSAGVVFSRNTALEVARRSQILLPLMRPDWRLLTVIREGRKGVNVDPTKLLMTRENLVAICQDAQLGFVVAKEKVGFDPISHTDEGNWKDWNLYECNRVRSLTIGP